MFFIQIFMKSPSTHQNLTDHERFYICNTINSQPKLMLSLKKALMYYYNAPFPLDFS